MRSPDRALPQAQQRTKLIGTAATLSVSSLLERSRPFQLGLPFFLRGKTLGTRRCSDKCGQIGRIAAIRPVPLQPRTTP
jgi:hypothetical protein